MAPGLKLWLGLSAGGLLIVAASALPPSATVVVPTGQEVSEQMKRYNALKLDARQSEATLRRIRWSDSLTALALTTSEDGLAVGGPSATVSPEVLTTLRGSASVELDRLARRSPNATVGFFVQPNDHGAHAGYEFHDGRVSDEIYMGVRDDEAYCLRVRTTLRKNVNDRFVRLLARGGSEVTNILGPCAYVAAYGMPGAGIHEWLERGGSVFAAGREGRPSIGTKWGYRRQFLGMRDFTGSVELDQCIAGAVEACTDVFANPSKTMVSVEVPDAEYVVEHSPATAIGLARNRSPFNSDDDYILADLEEEFGPERFAAFWTSEADVTIAFDSAFALPVGEWIIDWMERKLDDQDRRFSTVLGAGPGPGLDSWSVLSGLLLVALSAMLTGRLMGRRRVG